MARWQIIARTIGIWVCGLIVSGIVGGIAGTKIVSGYETEALPGVWAGMFAFACFRLWMNERRREISN